MPFGGQSGGTAGGKSGKDSGSNKGGGGNKDSGKKVDTPKGTQKTSGGGMATSANKSTPGKQNDSKSATHGKPATGFDKYGSGSAAGMVDAGVSARDVGRLATGGLNEAQGAAVRGQVQDIQDDGLGGLLGLIGLSERIDVDSILGNPANPQTDASWGFDPAGLVGGAVGLATGMPFVGTGLALASNAMGNPAEINLGPDVFGGGSGAGASNLADAGRDGGRGSGLLAGGTATPQQQAQAPAQPSPTPEPVGSTRMSGLLAESDTDYLRGVTARRPTPAQRFNPGVYTGRLVYDPTEGRLVPAPGA